MKKAVIFLDYNDTFDDVGVEKGQVFICSLKRLIKVYDRNVEIIVITAAKTKDELSIKNDLLETLSYFPIVVREKFRYLIENNCKYISKILHDNNKTVICERQPLSKNHGTKKDGVEIFLQKFYSTENLDACIFVGDNQSLDLIMMDANVGKIQKIFIYANKKILKSEKFPIYKISFAVDTTKFNYAKDVKQKTSGENVILHTSCKSYGAGKGLEVATCLLEDKQKNERIKN